MAGPLSSEEIEDVVSSVRRLVSNEQRIKTRDLNAEKLVLTSAYRVVPETSPLSPVSLPLTPLMLDAPLVEAPPEPAPDVPAVVDVAVPDAADPVSALEDSLTEALAVEVTPEQAGDAVSRSDSLDTPLVDAVEAEWEDEIWAEPGQVSLGEAALAAEEAEVLMAPEAEPEIAAEVIVAAAQDAAEPAPDETGSAWADEPIPFVPLRRRAEDLAARVAAGGVVETPATVDPVDADAQPEPAEPLPASVQELSQASAPVDEAPEPAPAEAMATTAAPSATMPEATLPHVATDLYDADGTPLAVLDEAALNDIVRQVLRAELQGELGERITRNVRKLVRAEINRALLARDLD